jgi:hypothetical protein
MYVGIACLPTYEFIIQGILKELNTQKFTNLQLGIV